MPADKPALVTAASTNEASLVAKPVIERPEKFGGMVIRSTHQAGSQGVNLTLYGPGGHGKTTLAATANDSEYGAPTYIVDAEGGAEVLTHLDVDYNAYYQWAQVERFLKALKTEPVYWKTVVWDNLTELAALEMRDRTSEPQIQDYGANTRAMLNFIREVRELSRRRGINMIFTAWDEWEKDAATQTFRKDIQLTPALQKAYPGIVSIVGHLSVDRKGDHILNFKPGPTTISKFRRTPGTIAYQIPPILREPSLGPIFDTLIGGKPFPKDRYALRGGTDANKPVSTNTNTEETTDV